jgi:hypothetical protein
VEPKFRLSPMIDAQLSQRLEDRNRDRLKKAAMEKSEQSRGTARGKEGENPRRFGPPAQKSEVAKKVAFVDQDSDKSRPTETTKEAFLKSKGLPYVEVAPLKATLRTSKPDRVSEDQTSKFGSTYKSRAPVEVGLDIERLIETVLDLEINIPLRSLAGVSNAVQKEIKKQVTKTRWPTEAEAKVNLLAQEEEEKPLVKVETLPVATSAIMTDVSEEIPEGYMIAADPVIQFLLENKDAEPGDLIVAKRSEALRAIYATINRVGQEECLLDDGSMIVSMAKEAAVELGLTWDPSVRINMESASNHVEKTLGLAKNVRLAVGGLNLYLQVHILENPPYRVLLGRPFGTLTSSTVCTKPDGSSEITLTDPNTKRVAIVPTYERGTGPGELQKQRYQAF